jgi:hypothetical protein
MINNLPALVGANGQIAVQTGATLNRRGRAGLGGPGVARGKGLLVVFSEVAALTVLGVAVEREGR